MKNHVHQCQPFWIAQKEKVRNRLQTGPRILLIELYFSKFQQFPSVSSLLAIAPKYGRYFPDCRHTQVLSARWPTPPGAWSPLERTTSSASGSGTRYNNWWDLSLHYPAMSPGSPPQLRGHRRGLPDWAGDAHTQHSRHGLRYRLELL